MQILGVERLIVVQRPSTERLSMVQRPCGRFHLSTQHTHDELMTHRTHNIAHTHPHKNVRERVEGVCRVQECKSHTHTRVPGSSMLADTA